MKPVIVIPALGDNFIYLFRYDENRAIAIDPSEALLVLNKIKQLDLELTAILGTHHHADHTAGIRELKHKTNCALCSETTSLIITVASNMTASMKQTSSHWTDLHRGTRCVSTGHISKRMCES